MLRHVRRWVHANMIFLLERNPNNLAARLNLEHVRYQNDTQY
mgnify:CR=1 FL=1